MADVQIMTSHAARRPVPSALSRSCWVTTPSSDPASMVRIWSCWFEGNTSMMRSIVCGASWVCRVPKTR